MMCHYRAHCLALWVLYCIVLSNVTLKIASFSGLHEEGMCHIVIIFIYMKVKLIINDNKQKLMIIKELFEGPV